MKRDFISIEGLKNVLSPKELKNILGGTGSGICCFRDGECVVDYRCTSDDSCKKLYGEGWCM